MASPTSSSLARALERRKETRKLERTGGLERSRQARATDCDPAWLSAAPRRRSAKRRRTRGLEACRAAVRTDPHRGWRRPGAPTARRREPPRAGPCREPRAARPSCNRSRQRPSLPEPHARPTRPVASRRHRLPSTRASGHRTRTSGNSLTRVAAGTDDEAARSHGAKRGEARAGCGPLTTVRASRS